ncbi:hypothetical protein A3J90_01145 [candidate division WOR-1 bacterium RIFOXYC2_FULL_37_10]|uniref:NADH:ubiquinone oxidoreductase intermediate-associated protein 30 domain-containing protein n=1 Tax=candidate division WOR-1 bacterium RIFOXYB2_FULL_37_13 TaxID=1802579 RepID=A0A1F4STY3_UNCSA|nr:MAG: hypothetical protein A2310_04130 [candidate division WOR-1 bacterium RIFOXYB2_FULL_37_13]OGC33311.1 MAG: hypothetical protein A3J90_01145 [candidate division WOR-1 bacterium RIFOXYC2_FULL_37_10]
MKYLAISLLFIVLLSLSSSGFGGSPPSIASNAVSRSIENFEKADFFNNQNWWTFGAAKIELVSNVAKEHYALSIKGEASNWFVGGIGGYIADFDKKSQESSSLEMDIYSYQKKNGMLKIELYDDDNGNWQIEQDPQNYLPLFDDKFVYELKIDWEGWKHISIPLSSFIDDNHEVGDNVWDPNFFCNSGGLLQMQFIAIAPGKIGSINFVMDNIGFN